MLYDKHTLYVWVPKSVVPAIYASEFKWGSWDTLELLGKWGEGGDGQIWTTGRRKVGNREGCNSGLWESLDVSEHKRHVLQLKLNAHLTGKQALSDKVGAGG